MWFSKNISTFSSTFYQVPADTLVFVYCFGWIFLLLKLQITSHVNQQLSNNCSSKNKKNQRVISLSRYKRKHKICLMGLNFDICVSLIWPKHLLNCSFLFIHVVLLHKDQCTSVYGIVWQERRQEHLIPVIKFTCKILYYYFFR